MLLCYHEPTPQQNLTKENSSKYTLKKGEGEQLKDDALMAESHQVYTIG